jgi:hypothetical protein
MDKREKAVAALIKADNTFKAFYLDRGSQGAGRAHQGEDQTAASAAGANGV